MKRYSSLVTPASATARYFSNPSDGINFGIIPYFNGLKALTIALRIKLDPSNWNPANDPGGIRTIASVWGPKSDSTSTVFILRQRTNGKDFDIYFQKSGSFYLLNTTDGPLFNAAGVIDSEWNTFFLEFVQGRADLKFWKANPALSTIRSVSGGSLANFDSFPSQVTGEFWIGKEAGVMAVNSIRGAIADFALFDGLISESERNHITAGATPDIVKTANLLFWAPLNGNGPTESTAKTSDQIVRNGTVFGTSQVPAPFTSPLTTDSNIIVSPTLLRAEAGRTSDISVTWGVLGPTSSPLMLKPSANYGTFSPSSASLGTNAKNTVTFKYVPFYSSQSDTISISADPLPSVSIPVSIQLPSAHIDSVRVLPHGQSILIDIVDNNGNPAKFINAPQSNNPTISINGGDPIKLIGPLTPITSGPPNTVFASWATYLLPSDPYFLSYFVAQDFKGGWAPIGDGYLGKCMFANSTGNDLNATATYTVTDLTPKGSYNLHATWVSYPALCPKATYTIYEDGKNIGAFSVDQSKYQSENAAWIGEINYDWAFLGKFTPSKSTVTVVVSNGSQSGVLAADAIRIERIRKFTTVKENDSVTISADQRWGTTTAGDIMGENKKPLLNLVGKTFSPISGKNKMEIGWNLDEPAAFSSAASFYNNRYGSSYIWYWPNTDHGPETDSFSNVLKLPYNNGPPVTPSALDLMLSINSADGVGQRGLASCPPGGIWFLKWRGLPNILSLVGTRPDDITKKIEEYIDKKTGENVAKFRITAGPKSTAPAVSLRYFHPTDPTAVPEKGSIKIFDPLADPDEKSIFSPYFLELIGGAKCIRNLNTFCYANPDMAEFSHLSDDSFARVINNPLQTLGGEVIKISPVNPGPESWYFRNSLAVKAVFAKPHKLSNGQMLAFGIGDPVKGGYQDFPTQNGGVIQVVGGVTIVLDEKTIMVTCAGGGGSPLNGGCGTITKDYEPPTPGAWQATCRVGMGPSLDTLIQLGKETNSTQWIPLPHPVTDDCCAKIADYLLMHSSKGQKYAIEFSNEVWNMNGGYFYCILMSNYFTNASIAGNTDIPSMGYVARYWYTYRAGQIHKIMHDKFAGAGRADDLIRVMGSQTGYAAGATAPTIGLAKSLNIPIDWLAIDGYVDNESAGGHYDPATTGALFDSMNIEQLIDLFAVHVRRDNSTVYVNQHRKMLDENGFTDTKLVVYEGSTANPLPAPRSLNRIATAQAILRHPDLYPIVMDWFKVQEEAGISLFNWFILNGGAFVSGGAGWACYPTYGMKAGRGNGIDGRFDNRINPQNLRKIVSVQGYAVQDWIKNAPARATFVGIDAVTQGNWKGKYGASGVTIAQDPSSTNLSINMSDVSEKLWGYPATDKKGLQGKTNRTAACWYSNAPIYFSVNTSKNSYRLTVYVLDWNNAGGGRKEQFEVLDVASGAVLDSQTISSFQNGTYLRWNVEGNVSIRITNLNPAANSVLSAIFVD